ncbi:permease [Pelosinus sp. UFO1]|uniref:permease n=1 Tax=Pelosinus sp. UFO1 TaxID=484770 RepID=UPI0004D150E1|nr:permease [Pelosinus sp. UFO1]AIF50475.1 Protein of unknown function DUF318, transmembrane [Pelosinus sp. UFO1]
MDLIVATISSTVSTVMSWNDFINFKIILLSIIIEAFPFLILSVMVSAMLSHFVSESRIRSMLPKNKFLSLIMACFLGILFPVCDCGMVPIVRRLVLKGVPLPTAIVFMLAAPIINPVVGAATAFAFRNHIEVVFLRLGAACFVALFTGLFINFFFIGNQLKKAGEIHSHTHGCCHDTTHNHPIQPSFLNKIIFTFRDASNEFFEMGKFLLIGAMLGSLSQILLPHAMLLTLGQNSFLSTGFMMLFAFFISVCSSADAFIAASFSTSFSLGSLVTFMVLGPMIDLKNLLMLLYTFRTRFVIWLALMIILLCSSAAYVINHL